ncbi:MAG: SPASM domain-containing protein [Desulfobacteraceae bacterium]|nr:SPASM domain-containing protein [Desulfobacteraceae bacterium]
MGDDYFAQAIELEPHGTLNLVQTNGFVHWPVLRMWKKLSFRVGTSLDLPLAVNKQTRCESSLESLFRVVKLYALYQKVGFLCVVTNLNVKCASDMLWFVRRFKTKFSVAFNMTAYMPRPADYAVFLSWWARLLLHDRRIWELEPVREMIINVVSGHSRYCSFSEDCQRNFLAIDPLGDCYPCNRWLGRHELCYGNIREGLDKILASPIRARFAERASILQKGPCHDCRWFEVCYGGCPFEGSLTNVDAYCQSYRATRDFIDDYLQKLGAEVNTDETIEDTSEIA